MSKFEDTRIVTFKEDYGVQKTDKDGKAMKDADGKPLLHVYYKKDSVHAIHYKVVEKIKANGGKFEAKEFDRKGYVAKEKEKRIKANKAQISVERR